MRLRKILALSFIFLTKTLFLSAQGYIPDPDSPHLQDIPTPEDSEEEKEQENTEETHSRREKIKTLYNEYVQKSDEVSEKQPITGSQFVGDFITDKLPLKLDLGAEPGEHGSSVFGILQYDWNKKNASRIRLEYNSEKSTEDTTNQLSTENSGSYYDKSDWLNIKKSRQIELDVYPYLHYFGDESIEATSPFIYFGVGAFYLFNWYSQKYAAWFEIENERTMLKIDTDGHYHQFGPIAIGSIKVPFFNIFGLSIEATFSPINRLENISDSKIASYALEEDWQYTMNTDNSQWCSPLLKIDIAIDVFTYFRLRTRFDYVRIYLGNVTGEEGESVSISDVNFLTFNTDNNRQETFKWRFGAEIVFPSSNRTRKKDAHLWAGLYYEHQWDVVTTDSDSNTNHSGKWILCLGT